MFLLDFVGLNSPQPKQTEHQYYSINHFYRASEIDRNIGQVFKLKFVEDLMISCYVHQKR